MLRDTRKERLLAWKLAQEPGGDGGGGADSGSWSAGDEKQRILQRRRANMAAPSLASMKSLREGDARAQQWQSEVERDAEAAALGMESRHGSNQEDSVERDGKGAEESLSSSSPSVSSDLDGDNQQSELGVFRDSDEGDPSFEHDDDAFKEALTYPGGAEEGDLAGSYFALDPSDAIPLDEQPIPLSGDGQQQEDGPQHADEEKECEVVHRSVETVEVDMRVRRRLETIEVPVDPHERPQVLAHEAADVRAPLSTAEEQVTGLRTPTGRAEITSASVLATVQTGATSSSSIPTHKSGGRGWRGFIAALLVTALAIGAAASSVAIWRDPTSPLAHSLKHGAVVTVTTVASAAVDSAHWAKNWLQRSKLAPIVEKLAVALNSVVEDFSHSVNAAPLYLRGVATRGWSEFQARADAAANQSLEMYHAVADKTANLCDAVKSYVVSRWSEYALDGRQLVHGGEDDAVVDPFAGERVRMAAIKHQLDHQEAWVAKELERMKARRSAYSSATDSLLSETKDMISDSIHETKDAAVQRIKAFNEQIAATLEGSTSHKVADAGENGPGLTDKTDAEGAGIGRSQEEFNWPKPAPPISNDVHEEVVAKAEPGAESLPVATDREQQSAEALAEVTTQRQVAQEAGETLSALEDAITAELTAAESARPVARVEAEENRAEAVDTVVANPRLDRELESAGVTLEAVDLVEEELLRIAKEEELELDITTVKVAAELLKTGAEIEDETFALHEQLEAARAVAESGAMESVCTEAHCVTDSEAVERVCEGVRCAAAAVEKALHDVDIEAGKRVADVFSDSTKPEVQLSETPDAVDVASPFISSSPRNATADLSTPSSSQAHLVPVALLSSAFLGLAIVSGFYLRRAWKLRQQRTARYLRWRRRAERKRVQLSSYEGEEEEEEEEEEAEEVVLLSGPSLETSSVSSSIGESDSASTSSSYEASRNGADAGEEAESMEDEEQTEDDITLEATQSSAQVISLESSAPVVETSSSFMHVTRHAAQRVLSYSPAASATRSRSMDPDESSQ